MARPFDTDHILYLGWHRIAVDYDYAVQIETLKTGHEDRNLDHDQGRHTFSINWDETDFCDYETLRNAYKKASGTFRGFYLDHEFFDQLIPVRFDSPFRFETVDEACCGDWFLSISGLQMVEVFDAPYKTKPPCS